MRRNKILLFLFLPLLCSAQYQVELMGTNPNVSDASGYGHRGHWGIDNSESNSAVIKYGYLYNWYAITNGRNIANTGWHVPTYSELASLETYLSTNTAGKLKVTGTTYWNSPNEGATNEMKFNAKGSGVRYADGDFDLIKASTYFPCTEDAGASTYAMGLYYDQGALTISFSAKKAGCPVRLINDTQGLPNGTEGTYTGNDGKVYKTIVINGKEWTAENLCETKFRDGTNIYEVSDGTEWSNLAGSFTMGTTSGGNAGTFGMTGYETIFSQSFTVTDCKIGHVTVSQMGKEGIPVYKIRMSIYNSSSDLPTTLIAQSTNTVDPNQANGIRTFYFDNVSLSSGTYCLVTSYEDVVTHNYSNKASFYFSTTAQYAGGKYAFYSNGTWYIGGAYADFDWIWVVYYKDAARCFYENDESNVYE